MGTRARARAPIPRELMVKEVDAWWTVLIVDPVATRVVPGLAGLAWVTPTRVTLLAHVLGVVSAVLFANGSLALGALVFEARFLADCVDGKLARVTGRSSVFGQILDAVGDRFLVVANLAALGWAHAPIAVVLLAAAYPLQFHLFEMRAELLAEQGGERPSDQLMAGGLGGWLARRRLYPVPTSVDVEHIVLVVLPVLAAVGPDLVRAGIWFGAVYFALQCARYGASLLRTAAALDRSRRAHGQQGS